MMQYFEWYLPENCLFWERCRQQAPRLKEDGFDMMWLPPAYKGASGARSVGYDVYDTYDLGEFDQKDTVATKYGTKEEYLNAVKALQDQGIEVLADVVLNHMMGADGLETVKAEKTADYNREQEIGEPEEIDVWTKFTFPGRNGKYSDFSWSASNFSGTDWDERRGESSIFRFEGKKWNTAIDDEYVNFDYLMGADLDMDNPETVRALHDWGKWYLDTVGMDGFRLDAVKHIKFEFYRDWLKEMRAYTGKPLFTVGEYWSSEIDKLMGYLKATDDSLALFDVPLHFKFHHAATSDGQFDMTTLYEDTLTKEAPKHSVTFVDNHDTQPGQSLESFIPQWFKTIAYALILLHKDGIPCVFYGDYYGIPRTNVAPVTGIKKLVKMRKYYAYGRQEDYFDDPSIVGFTRSGDSEHPDSGLALLVSNGDGGTKKMNVGRKFAGQLFCDVMGGFSEPVKISSDGWGMFTVNGGSVSAWVTEEAYRRLWVETE